MRLLPKDAGSGRFSHTVALGPELRSVHGRQPWASSHAHQCLVHFISPCGGDRKQEAHCRMHLTHCGILDPKSLCQCFCFGLGSHRGSFTSVMPVLTTTVSTFWGAMLGPCCCALLSGCSGGGAAPCCQCEGGFLQGLLVLQRTASVVPGLQWLQCLGSAVAVPELWGPGRNCGRWA